MGNGPVVERQEHGLRSRGSARRLRTIHRRRRIDDERERARARLSTHLVQAPAGLPVPNPYYYHHHHHRNRCFSDNLLAAAAPTITTANAVREAVAVRVPVRREELSGLGDYPEHRYTRQHAVAHRT